jgi:hypothetical protein
MPMPHLISVNVGLPRDIAWRGKTVERTLENVIRLIDRKSKLFPIGIAAKFSGVGHHLTVPFLRLIEDRKRRHR